VQPPPPETLTQLLHDVRAGEEAAVDSLLALAYAELGRLARMHLPGERGGHVLQPTALVHEAWMKLAGHLDGVEDRRHFFAIASQAMRQVLTDHARSINCQKREGRAKRVTIDESQVMGRLGEIDLIDLDDSLNRLATLNTRHARVVELRIFGGLTIAETAESLAISDSTVEKDWFAARAWLRRELSRAR